MNLITLAQIIVGLLVIILILLQEESSAGLGGAFGGGDHAGSYHTKRGLEKIIFYATIILVLIFTGLSLTHLL